MKKAIFALVLALSLFALSGGAALAHECFNVNRSDKGNEAAGSHSKSWFTLGLDDIAADIGLDAAQTEAFLTAADEAGVPLSFTIFVGKHTIGEKSVAYTEGGKATDGKGIDWFFTAYGETLFGILCGEIDPTNPECAGPPQ